MRVLVMGGTEFISLHLVQALRRDGHEVTVLNRGRQPRAACPPACATIVADRKDHAALRRALAGGARRRRWCDVTYAPTTRRGRRRRCSTRWPAGSATSLFVSTGARLRPRAGRSPSTRTRRARLYWGEYAKQQDRRRGRAAASDTASGGLPVTIVRPTHVYGPLNTRNNETFFFDRLVRGRPDPACPATAGWLRQFGHVEDLADAMAAMLGVPAAFGQAYNVMRRGGHHPGRLRRADRRGDQAPAHARQVAPAPVRRLGAPARPSARTSCTTATPSTPLHRVRARARRAPALHAGRPGWLRPAKWYQRPGPGSTGRSTSPSRIAVLAELGRADRRAPRGVPDRRSSYQPTRAEALAYARLIRLPRGRAFTGPRGLLARGEAAAAIGEVGDRSTPGGFPPPLLRAGPGSLRWVAESRERASTGPPRAGARRPGSS